MTYRTVSIDNEPDAVQRFFQLNQDAGVVVEQGGRPICILYPVTGVALLPERSLKDVAGAWKDIPSEVLREIAGDQP